IIRNKHVSNKQISVPLIWSRAQQVIVTPFGQKSDLLKLVCHAKSFPHPHFQWLDDGREIDNETTDTCVCSAKNVYSCRVWNEVENRSDLSVFYRAPGKQFRSELVSGLVDLSAFVSVDDEVCDRCKQEQLARLQRIMDDQDGDKTQPDMETQQLFASDKVALIISNCNYEYLPDLITPHCDAETLAQALQDMNYKTVTLGNLNLAEMQFIIREYKKLLGNGVYGMLYYHV
ncbi:unnamed protein product, partial [Anisakis simplex]|uniref:Ig-like domain-containing protein n=1 Tax=Anisakis simplex TaxID=6269 RepID=A0A0M3J590_ANISI